VDGVPDEQREEWEAAVCDAVRALNHLAQVPKGSERVRAFHDAYYESAKDNDEEPMPYVDWALAQLRPALERNYGRLSNVEAAIISTLLEKDREGREYAEGLVSMNTRTRLARP
jgi:predicted metal-dependent HD superfamily phosphohydrolase